MTQYIVVDTDTKTILYGIGKPDPEGFVGPINLPPEPENGFEYEAWQGDLNLSAAPTSTSVYEWDGTAPIWVEKADLLTLKTAKNAEINSARLAASRKSFTYGGKEIACDELSRSDIDGINGIVSLMQTLPIGWVGGWKAIDNTYVAIPTVNDWKAFYGAMVTKGQSNFAHAQDLKVLLLAATTAQQVADIKWEAQ